jgi:hypothetical protein
MAATDFTYPGFAPNYLRLGVQGIKELSVSHPPGLPAKMNSTRMSSNSRNTSPSSAR